MPLHTVVQVAFDAAPFPLHVRDQAATANGDVVGVSEGSRSWRSTAALVRLAWTTTARLFAMACSNSWRCCAPATAGSSTARLPTMSGPSRMLTSTIAPAAAALAEGQW